MVNLDVVIQIPNCLVKRLILREMVRIKKYIDERLGDRREFLVSSEFSNCNISTN